MRKAIFLLFVALAPATAAKGHQRAHSPNAAKGDDRDLFGHITGDIQRRSQASLSPYEKRQGMKLLLGQKNGTLAPHIVARDAQVEKYIFRDFSARARKGDPLMSLGPGKSILCVGARLGGEVRAFTRLGALAVGIDFNPGVRNAWSMWGDATRLQFADSAFDFVCTSRPPSATNLAAAAAALTTAPLGLRRACLQISTL